MGKRNTQIMEGKCKTRHKQCNHECEVSNSVRYCVVRPQQIAQSKLNEWHNNEILEKTDEYLLIVVLIDGSS